MTTTNGLLLVDKAGGLTSHDVVARVRRILHERRVGHAGTLDPMATGLLVLGVGPSTRLLRFAVPGTKRYEGTVRFGVATDSHDADGAVVEERPVPALSPADVAAAAAAFLGERQQVPPMVSALKVGGQRLHQLARAGVEVDRPPRAITVAAFALRASEVPVAWHFEVECSAGTYVRVLLSDLARSLDTLGHLTALRRVKSGSLRVEDAVTLEALEDLCATGRAPLRPPGEFVAHLERTVLAPEDERRVRHGQRLSPLGTFAGSEVAAFNGAGDLIAVLVRRGDAWQPELVLPDERTATHG